MGAPHDAVTAAGTRCTSCNWHPHDVAIHGAVCKLRGHPLSVVGMTAKGSCKACRAQRAKKYADADRERERARCRAYHWRNRASIVARKRSKRGGRAIVGARRGHRGAAGAPPPPQHPWRASNASPGATRGETTASLTTGGRSVAGPSGGGARQIAPAHTSGDD